ncbi:hypothetical protein GCM10010129_83920 [Streptomyces fumigatiscleroticus]|nr:hypothetical protein GCM10010129_83920 [Streptomyces fumigatiscleroticus]
MPKIDVHEGLTSTTNQVTTDALIKENDKKRQLMLTKTQELASKE